MSADVPDSNQPAAREAAAHPRADGAHLILAALDHLRGGLSADGSSSGSPSLARQKENLREWARGLGLLLSQSDLPPKVVRGGQEHDVYHHEATDRYFKVTRDGIFGLSPDTLIPFDVIPCRPDGGFLQFIADTLAAGHTVSAVRTVSTFQRHS